MNPSLIAAGVVKRLGVATRPQQPDVLAKCLKVYQGGWDEYDALRRHIGIPNDQLDHFTKAGIVLQPKQLEFIYWARQADQIDAPSEIGFGGARGGGKSLALFVQAAIDDCQRFDGLKVLYLRQTGKRAAEQMLDLVTSTLMNVKHVYSYGKVEFPNGSRIIMGHYLNEKEAMNYLGLEYDVIIIEETTTLSEAAYKKIRLSARSSKGFRPRVYNSTNPLGVGHTWYKKRFIDPMRKGDELELKRKFIFATIDDNVFVNPEYVDNLDDLTGVEKRAYRFGDWDVSAGAYFETWNYDLHTIPALDSIPETWEVWGSMDYGYAHWNVILLHAKDGDGNIYTFHELAHRKYYPEEIAVDLARVLEQYRISLDDFRGVWVGVDAFAETGRGKKTIAQEYIERGFTMFRADVSPGSRIRGAQQVARLLGNPERNIDQQLYITRNCERLIETLPAAQRDPNHMEDILKVNCDENGVGGDDSVDALRYGLYRPNIANVG